MYSIEVIKESISRMDDDELVERWRKEMFIEEAKPIVEEEFQKRGIDPKNYETEASVTERANSTHKPIFIPALFAAIGGGTTGGKVGGAIAGAIGAGIGAIALAAVGWYLGRLAVVFASKWKSQGVRILFYCTALLMWFFMNAIATALSLWGSN